DPVGGCVQGIGHRRLRHPRAVDGGAAHVAGGLKLLLHRVQAHIGIQELVADSERGHHGETRVADLAELSAQLGDPRFQGFGEFEQPHLLPLLASHAVLPAVDGDVDVAHVSPPPSSMARTLPIAASSRSAISRLVRSSLRVFTSELSSSCASRERSTPSAWMRLASSFSSRSESRRRSTACSSDSSADIRRRVAASRSNAGPPALPHPLAGRSFIRDLHVTLARPATPVKLRFGKRLDGEVYVAEAPRATRLPSYAPLSNFS